MIPRPVIIWGRMSFIQIDRRSIANFDYWLVIFMTALAVVGIINLGSAASETTLWKTQTWWFLIGLGAATLVLLVDYKRYEALAPLIYAGALLLLAGLHLLPLMGLEEYARKISGARSWYTVFERVHLQPSELMKVALIIVFARIYGRDTRQKPWGIRELAWPVILSAVPVAFILMEPDMGTALIVALLASTMALFAGIKRSILATAIVVLVLFAVSYPLWKTVLKPHQQDRIESFIHPEKDPRGAGYNVLQSKIAIGSGGLSGKGYKKGNVHMLRYLPEQQTDFVFSVWAEEWGFAWVSAAIILYGLIIFRGLSAAREAKDRFGVMLAVGVSALLFWHTFVNISMVVGIFPVIGVPLPFMSYGGSSLITFMIATAIIINVRMRKYFF